ncbi:hypothetical protein SESBI_06459 [Sesbania bispinosa]|nr:hypothetical protein SESBI_06459 [Sesbania bispinosa]
MRKIKEIEGHHHPMKDIWKRASHDRKYLWEKLIDVESLKKGKWDIGPFLERQKIGTFFGEDLKVYPSLTRAFYAAVAIEWYGERTPRIRRCIKGKEILLDCELICKLTGFASEGIFLYNEKDWMEVADVTKKRLELLSSQTRR